MDVIWEKYETPIINGTLTVTDGTGSGGKGEGGTPVESPYTVSLTPSASSVAQGGTVDMDVAVSGAGFNAYDITVSYDASLFTYGDDATGSVNIVSYGGSWSDGDTVETLTFTAKDGVDVATEGTFTVTKAKIAVSMESMTKDAYGAATEAAAVTVLPQYTVKFQDYDGNLLGEEQTVTQGSTAAAPDEPSREHYTFVGWSSDSGETVLTSAEVNAQAVTGSVTYTATYAAETYTVTLGEGLSGADTAAYGQDYTGAVDNADTANYTYTVTVTYGEDGEKTFDVEDDGSFTIPAADINEIAGNMTLTVSKTPKGVNVAVYEDYVGGYSLVVAYGASSVGYDYDGNAMYRTAHYDSDEANTDETRMAYAYIVLGAVTETDALAKLTVAANAAEAVTANVDINATGKIDVADAQAVWDCYNVQQAVEQFMVQCLRADIDASHVVDAGDADAVLSADSYTNS